MTTATATEFKNHFGQYLEQSLLEPVVIEKMGRSVAVMIPFGEYERLRTMENEYWAGKAEKAEKTGYIGKKESLSFLKGN